LVEVNKVSHWTCILLARLSFLLPPLSFLFLSSLSFPFGWDSGLDVIRLLRKWKVKY